MPRRIAGREERKLSDKTIYLLSESQVTYDRSAQSYQANHPNVKVKTGMCFGVEVFVEVMASWPNSGFYTLAGLFPSLKRYVNHWDLKRGYGMVFTEASDSGVDRKDPVYYSCRRFVHE